MQAATEHSRIAAELPALAREFGFERAAVAGIDLARAEERLERWLELGRHGTMGWMARHGRKRTRPARLLPGTLRVLCFRMHYWPRDAAPALAVLADPDRAYISRYALGRDYHRLMRRRLKKLAERIASMAGPMGYRVFVDSAPVMEKPLAAQAGLGWMGKHTNLIDRHEGSWFFLGEIYTDLPLPVDRPVTDHCGSCRACLDICPTEAIVAPYQLDARRCISYLTIEHRGSIPLELRPRIGNRVFGCDDCQLVCPWNRHARPSEEAAFAPRGGLDNAGLTRLFAWDEEQWRERTRGSALRRAGYTGWLRNLAIALGNAARSGEVIDSLRNRLSHSSELVREHVCWALERQAGDQEPAPQTTLSMSRAEPSQAAASTTHSPEAEAAGGPRSPARRTAT
ncbi:MAG: tRNA epoxyqueuosine(34) reductase QueG [Gammaproteobacteria bacterium]|nr:tRNA epoxyqueuosine(34) reductase QueG [Gammaproteobacteria bacterium]